MFSLRPRQEECLDAIFTSYVAGIHQQLVVQATGTGKAVVIANLARKMRQHLPGKMLVFVHTEELVKQLVETCEQWNPELKVGREQSNFYADLDCDIVVSCVASIGRKGADRLQRFGGFDIIACDEAHHSIASTYLSVFDIAGVIKPDTNKLLVGFTATPKRKNVTRAQKNLIVLDDEEILSLKSVYKKIVFTYTIRKAIKEGWLVPLRGFKLKTDVDLSEVKSTGGDYQQDDLSEAVNTSSRNLQVIKFWLDNAGRRTTIVFTVDIKHAQDLAKEFKQAGVKAEAVWGTNPERNDSYICSVCNNHLDAEAEGNSGMLGKPCKTRRSTFCTGMYGFKRGIINRFKADEIEVLCNCGVLIEGFDAWNVMAVLDAAPTKSSSKYTQKIGRGTRLEEGTGNLLEALKAGIALRKKDCYILDVVDNNKRCSLVTLPSLLGLNPDFDLHGQSVTAVLEEIEAVQDKFPDVDFSKLTDLSNVKAYVESLDLFAEPYTQEVKEFSELKWMQTADGAFVLPVPEKRDLQDAKLYHLFLHEKLHIVPTELDEYELSITTVNDERKLGTFSSLKEAFETADEVVRRCRPDRVKLIQREAAWHNSTASDASKKYLKKLVGKKPFIYCVCPVGAQCSGAAGTLCKSCNKQQMSAGQVSIAINKMKIKA